jgi:glycosyltransferase involved in cell wall biosynthesis
MSKISAVIVAHNEEKKIEECLQSLHFVDEIVVVLDKCTDRTKEIVQKFANKIIEGSWNIEGARRNIALSAASGDWVLEIDADERISPELAQEILAVKNSAPCGFFIPIANYVGMRFVKFGWLRTLGVVQRQSLTFRGLKRYHEDKEIHPTFDLNAEIKSLKNPIIHLVDDDVSDLILRFNRYTSWKASDMLAKGKIRGGFFRFIFDFKLRFFKSFVIKKGYKDGALGLLIALLAGLYPLVSYLKAKERNK